MLRTAIFKSTLYQFSMPKKMGQHWPQHRLTDTQKSVRGPRRPEINYRTTPIKCLYINEQRQIFQIQPRRKQYKDFSCSACSEVGFAEVADSLECVGMDSKRKCMFDVKRMLPWSPRV